MRRFSECTFRRSPFRRMPLFVAYQLQRQNMLFKPKTFLWALWSFYSELRRCLSRWRIIIFTRRATFQAQPAGFQKTGHAYDSHQNTSCMTVGHAHDNHQNTSCMTVKLGTIKNWQSVFEIKRNWWSPKLKAGVRGSSPGKNFKFKVAKPPEI